MKALQLSYTLPLDQSSRWEAADITLKTQFFHNFSRIQQQTNYLSSLPDWYHLMSDDGKLTKCPIYFKASLTSRSVTNVCQNCQHTFQTVTSISIFFFDSQYFVHLPQRSGVAEIMVPKCVMLQRLHTSLASNFRLIDWVTQQARASCRCRYCGHVVTLGVRDIIREYFLPRKIYGFRGK